MTWTVLKNLMGESEIDLLQKTCNHRGKIGNLKNRFNGGEIEGDQ